MSPNLLCEKLFLECVIYQEIKNLNVSVSGMRWFIRPLTERFECDYHFGKIVTGRSPTQPPTRMQKSEFSIFSSREIASSLVSSHMIFEALQYEIFRFEFYSLKSKIQKIPGFNLSNETYHLWSSIAFSWSFSPVKWSTLSCFLRSAKTFFFFSLSPPRWKFR